LIAEPALLYQLFRNSLSIQLRTTSASQPSLAVFHSTILWIACKISFAIGSLTRISRIFP
jgi:hypothetical protein